MAHLTADAMSWLSSHHGIITTERLGRSGVSRRTTSTLVEAGVLVREARGVFRIASSPLTLDGRCVIASASHPDGFVTGPTGGRLLGLRRMGSRSEVHFSAAHGIEFDQPGIILRQSTIIERTDVHRRADGINVASPWRLAFDLAADLSDLDHASVVEQLLHDRRCGLSALVLTARRLAHPARPGSKRFLDTLSGRVPGGPLESHPEVELARLLRARGVPVVAQTTWLDLPNGKRARLDLSVPEIRWGIEVDVHPDHLLLDGTTRDRRRDRQAHQLDWQIDRVTGLDLLMMDELLDELDAIHTARRTQLLDRTRVPNAR